MDNAPADAVLRVLFLITDLGKGGAERFLIDLCSAFRGRSDVDFLIGTLYDDNRYSDLTTDLPIVPLHYRPFSFTKRHDYPEYRRVLEDFRPHVVHTHRYLAEFLSAQHVSDRITYVCHGHDNMVQFGRLAPSDLYKREAVANRLEKSYLIRKKYRRARTFFVANSSHTLGYFRSVLPRFMREDVHLLPCGFDYGRFHAEELRVPRVGERLRIVNVGSFQEKKNQIFIVRIAEELRRSGVDFHVDLLGDGALRAGVQAEVERHGLQDRVFLHGNVDRVEEWLRRSHIYVHTAWYEPFGLVLLEAMAAGLPCVALDGKGNRDLLQQGRTGFLIERQDPAEFAARIQQLAASPAAFETVARQAQAFAAEFDIGRVADRFVAFYRERRGEGKGGGEPPP
jgi:glycosyltransferase involved in cell wall biosynthesis